MPAQDRVAVVTLPAEIDTTNARPAAPSTNVPGCECSAGDGQCDADRRATLRKRARDLREQAQRLLAQSDALANALKDYTRGGGPDA
jgi:hypothetical protein